MMRSKYVVAFVFAKLRDLLLTLLLMSLAVFLLFYIIPGDPVAMMLGTEASPEKRAALEEALALDSPPMLRYVNSIYGIFSQEQPVLSLRFQVPVRELLPPRFSLSLTLAVLSFLLVVFIAVPLAILSAVKENSCLDHFFAYLSEFFMAIPGFFLGIALLWIFALLFQVFKAGEYIPPEQGWGRHLKSLLLPALALALPKVAQAQQFYRTALIETREQAYARTALAKGAGPIRLFFSHLLRNSLPSLLITLGLIFADLLTGTLVVEQVFVLPGVGRLLFTAISARDLPLAQAIILTIATLVVLTNTLVDILHAVLDPRLVSREAQVLYGGST